MITPTEGRSDQLRTAEALGTPFMGQLTLRLYIAESILYAHPDGKQRPVLVTHVVPLLLQLPLLALVTFLLHGVRTKPRMTVVLC